MIVTVIGKGRNCPPEIEQLAFDVGVAVMQADCSIATGGLGGVMLHAALGWDHERRANFYDGHACCLGFVPADAEPHAAFPGTVNYTGLPVAVRNVVTASCCDRLVALDGSHGTMQELAVALDREIPCASYNTTAWQQYVDAQLFDQAALYDWLHG